MKKMSFSKLGIYLFCLVTLATLLTVGNLAEASLVRAQKFADSGPAISPTGRVLQASTGNIGNDIQDALQLESIPPNPSLGSKAQLKVSVKKDKLIPGDDQLGFTVIGWANCGIFSCDKVFEKDIKGTDAIIDYVVTPEIFKNPGQKTLTVKATSVFTSFGSTRTTYIGSVSINVVPGSENSSSLSVTRETRDGQIAVKEFTAFSQGAASVNFDCGNGQKGTVSAASGSAKFECRYPISSPGTFQIKAIAQGPTGQQVGEALNGSVSITGQEASTGDSAQQNRLQSCVLGPETLVCIVNLLFGVIGTLIETAVRGTFLLIVGPAIEVLTSIHTWDDNFANVIYPSWLILRNLTNIAFILAIVAMGVATVFRISGYAVKDMMIKLIFGAFLVNFSLVIPQAVLGIAETVQNQFLPPNTGAIRAIANPLFTLNLFNGAPDNVGFGSFSESIRIFMNVWMIVFAFIAFAALACLLIIRLAIIWLLLLSSPLPYAAMIFPATRKFASDWWGRLIEWAFITPVMAFMLNLTANITLNQKKVIENLSNVKTDSLGVGDASVLYVALSSGLPIIFLFATLKISTALATKAGGLASTVMSKASTLTGLGAGGALGYAMKPAKRVLYDPLADKARTKYNEKLADWTAPDESDSRKMKFIKRMGFAVGAPKKFFGDIKSAREADLAAAKSRVGDVSQDYRNRARGKPLYAADKAHNKRVEESAEKLINETDANNNQKIKYYLDEIHRGQKLTDYQQAELEARINRSVENKQFKDILEHPQVGNDILQFYDLMSRSGSNSMQSKNRTGSLAKKLNAGFISSGNIHNVVNADNPTLANDIVVGGVVAQQGARSRRATILKNKSDIETASVRSFFQGADILTATNLEPDAAEWLAAFVMSTKDPRTLAEKVSEMSGDNKKDYRKLIDNGLLRTELRTSMLAHNGGAPDVPTYDSNGTQIGLESIDDIINRFRARL